LFNSEISVLINLLLENIVRRYNFPPLKIKSRCESRLQTLSAMMTRRAYLLKRERNTKGRERK
jgi:hypothetical protein